MKTTKDLYNVDPTQFRTMLYPDVLAIKKTAAEKIYKDANTEMFNLPYKKTSVPRAAELDIDIKKANKALKYICLWQEELGKEPDYSHLLLKATEICISAHAGQMRKDGVTPYSVHPIGVAAMMTTDLERIVALLHDVVEDTDMTIKDIKALFGDQIAFYVHLLTHKEYESYFDYIRKLAKYPVCVKVKIADIVYNLADDSSDKSKIKYKKAMRILL